jgi:hypothetical protein
MNKENLHIPFDKFLKEDLWALNSLRGFLFDDYRVKPDLEKLPKITVPMSNKINICKGAGCKAWKSEYMAKKLSQNKGSEGVCLVPCMGQCGGGVSVQLEGDGEVLKLRETDQVTYLLDFNAGVSSLVLQFDKHMATAEALGKINIVKHTRTAFAAIEEPLFQSQDLLTELKFRGYPLPNGLIESRKNGDWLKAGNYLKEFRNNMKTFIANEEKMLLPSQPK